MNFQRIVSLQKRPANFLSNTEWGNHISGIYCTAIPHRKTSMVVITAPSTANPLELCYSQLGAAVSPESVWRGWETLGLGGGPCSGLPVSISTGTVERGGEVMYVWLVMGGRRGLRLISQPQA